VVVDGATLVKELEADGVGRPSTYASILSTIQEREYVKKEGGKFIPTELGMVVTDLLLESFQNLFDVTYTAGMEEKLDSIEEGKMDWREAMAEFYGRFQKDLEHAERPHDRHQGHGGTTGENCEASPSRTPRNTARTAAVRWC
jgi:DNA topoisomerase-1